MFLRTLHSRCGVGVAVLLCCTVGLLLAAAAAADQSQPIAVGPVTVANGAASATTASDGSSTVDATVTVNGQPASVDANGNISANVDLSGQSAVTVSVGNAKTGETTTTTIPISLLGPGGVIPASVLDMLRQAGVTVNVPPGGFTGAAGQPVHVTGSVADRSTLASLTVNGIDVLSRLRPDGTFAVPVAGTDKTVAVSATDKQGVSQSTTYRITPATSPASGRSSSTASTSAASAIGVTITNVRYVTKGVKARKRISVTLLVKDKRGLLIRGAKVRIRAAAFQHSLVLGTQLPKTTNAAGRVTFVLRLRAAKFSQRRRLFTVKTALTPSAQTTRTTSVRLPRLAARR